MKYEVIQNGKKLEIVFGDKVIDEYSLDDKLNANKRCEAINAILLSWDKKREEKQATKKQRQSKIKVLEN